MRITSFITGGKSKLNTRSNVQFFRKGYILLISILAVGVISSAIVSTLLLLGTSAGTFGLGLWIAKLKTGPHE